MQKPCNVLQYEFFHVGGKEVGSLEKLLAECVERIFENLPLAMAGCDTVPGIKTVVRIYDLDGQVTAWANEVQSLEAQCQVWSHSLKKNSVTSWCRRWQIGRLNRCIERDKELMVGYFTEYIGKSFKSEWNIARETGDHAFRKARREEYIELQQAAIMAKNFCLFIFEPNDLLADRNRAIISLLLPSL